MRFSPMHFSRKNTPRYLLCAAACFSLPVAGHAQAASLVRRVQVLHNQGQVEIEIEASDRMVPQTQLLANPDRLVVDFPNALPGVQLRNQAVNREQVKSVRVGLFSAKPPVTRIVLDLNGPQRYQVFPDGRTVIVKVGDGAKIGVGVSPATAVLTPAIASRNPVVSSSNSGAHSSRLGLVNATYQPARITPPPPIPPPPPLQVSFHDGLLSISANKANLSEILAAVHQRTGADIAIPAGAEQEQVMGEMGPAPAPEVLAHLLNGSKFNFLILSSPNNPGALDRVILSPRSEALAPLPLPPSVAPQPTQASNQPEEQQPETDIPPASAAPVPPAPTQPPPVPPDVKTGQGDSPE
jgi:hypothetical protein